MLETRRGFMQSTAAMAARLSVVTVSCAAQPQRGQNQIESTPNSEIRMPKVKFGSVEVSRLILGTNPFYGFAHFNSNYGAAMRGWYTPERVVEVLRRCEELGVNAYNYVHLGRAQADWERYLAEGGRMRLVAQAVGDDPAELVRAVKPMAAWVQGERVDNAYRAGKMDSIRDYCKKLKDLGVAMVGVGSHIPEVLMLVEEQGWPVDFYAGCVYNRRRTPEELRQLLGGELPEMLSEVYLQNDPARMYKVFRQTRKPCVAFKILAAGRVAPEQAFQRAFDSIKPADMVCVGMFPRVKDEMKEDAYYASRYGAARQS